MTALNLHLSAPGNILAIPQLGEFAEITYRSLRRDEQGAEVIELSACELTNWLARRVIKSTVKASLTPAAFAAHIIELNAGADASASRKLPITVDNRVSGGQIGSYTVERGENLLDAVLRLCKASNFGIKTECSPRTAAVTLALYSGINRTSGQAANPPAVFAEEYENIADQQLTLNLDKLVTAAEYDYGASSSSVTGSGDGLDRYEAYYSFGGDYSGSAQALLAAEQNIAASIAPESFSGAVLAEKPPLYRVGYDVGDTVTVLNRAWNFRADLQIVRAVEIAEGGRKEVSITWRRGADAGTGDHLRTS